MRLLIILNLIIQIQVMPLDPLYQVLHTQVYFKDDNFTWKDGFSYGIWSKYNPLSITSQVGPVGLQESNCFQLHNAYQIDNQSLNLIYYDFLDYESKTISKTLEFINNNNEQHKIQVQLEIFNYENVWYFLGISGTPKLNQLEIILFSLIEVLHFDILSMSYPYQDQEIQLTFGGSLIVLDSKIESIQYGTKFSYFPGSIVLRKFQIEGISPGLSLVESAKIVLGKNTYCQCTENNKKKIADSDLDYLDYGTYISENLNCDSFFLSGWIRIQEIINLDDGFEYQFIKLGLNYENQKFSNLNLSPLTLSYKISSVTNKIIITTYSYTFPIVTLDFLDNPFLIITEFDVINDLTLWHNFQIQVKENKMNIQIKFLDKQNVYEFQESIIFLQFKQNQFKLLYGNCQQLETNFLKIQIRDVTFTICEDLFTQQICHLSCQDCDGPTNRDCLSCPIDSNRSYLNEQKACICPIHTIDVGICHSYQDSKLIILQQFQQWNQCKYGYFQYNQECCKCPSIIREDFITCLECLRNPGQWSKDPQCKTHIYVSPNGDIDKSFYDESNDHFVFDGISSIQYCQYCENTGIDSIENLFSDFSVINENFKNLCFNELPNCYKCQLFACQQCYVSESGFKCSRCTYQAVLTDGFCTYDNSDIRNTCVSPYYISSTFECKLCPIDNCKYCFEFQQNESQIRCTLYKDFEEFINDERIQIGCALCKENYIFDFNQGLCLYQKPQITNCLRSYINFQGQSVCTLSSFSDFSIAPEIINCQKYQKNCQQCLLTPDEKIQCIICEPGYKNSIQTGTCFQYKIDNAIIVMDGDFYENDAWSWFIQSFMMRFLPNNYYYPLRTTYTSDIVAMPTKCTQGYDLSIFSQCAKQCSQDCLKCEKSYENFICQKCPLNYFNTPIRTQEDGQCISCPQLCEICRNREQGEIKKLQPSFQLSENNKKYTMICLKPIKEINVVIDPYTQIAKYCFSDDCQTHFSLMFTSDDIFQSCENQVGDIFTHYEDGINIDYCNSVGVDQITIDYTFYNEFTEEICYLICPLIYWTNLKTKIFMLNRTNLIITSKSSCLIKLSSSSFIQNFDEVEIHTMGFLNVLPFILENDKNKIGLKLHEVLLQDSVIKDNTIFQTEFFSNITLKGLRFQRLTFENSYVFNLEQSKFEGYIEIETLLIENCILNNSTLFNFANKKFIISIQKVTINQCYIYNSSFFSFISNNSKFINFVYLTTIIITNSNFVNSFLINSDNYFNLNIKNLGFNMNIVKFSTIISFDYNLELSNVQTNKNTFVQSQFIAIKNAQSKDKLFCIINNYQALENILQEAILFLIFSGLAMNNIVFSISDIYISEIDREDQTNIQLQLFKIHSNQFNLQNAVIQNTRNCLVFYIIENEEVVMKNVTFQSTQAAYRIPLNLKCWEALDSKNAQPSQLLGFSKLISKDVDIYNQFSSIYSQIQVNFGRQFLNYSLGRVELSNIRFEKNMLLQKEKADLFSLLVIYSYDELLIFIDNIKFKSNFLHQFIDNPLETQAGLIYIQSLLSKVEIHSLFCELNAVTNSSNSFITINSYSIQITNYQVLNHNMLPQELWESYFGIQFNQNIDQAGINLAVQDSIKILNKGGAGQIIASIFSCTNCYFQNILAHQSAIFEIQTQNQGNIILNNIAAYNIETNLQSISSTGCIAIYSQNSILNLKIVGGYFENILNRMSSTILTIQTSVQGNKINLDDIQIINCISLMNQFFNIQFSSLSQQSNIVNVQHFKAIQTEEFWIKYFDKIGIISQSEISNIISNTNAVIAIDGGSIQIRKFLIEGIFLSPILKFNNLAKLKMKECQFSQIQPVYPFNLISISQTEKIKSIIYLDRVQIIKHQAYSVNSSVVYFLKYIDIRNQGCVLESNLINQEEKIYLNDFIENVIELAQKSSSLVQISLNSIEDSLILYKVDIQDNICKYCDYGIIYLQIENCNLLKIQDFNCGFNIINEYGCLNIAAKTQIYPKIQIKDSSFIKNKASIGAAIMASNMFLKLENSYILGNSVTISGGGIHLIAINSELLIKQTIILSNEASEGGGIYLEGDGKLNDINFVSSYLLFNKATSYGNNLVETPSHLALFINGKEMQSQSYIQNNTLTNSMNLKPYNIIQQGKNEKSNTLMLPSNQQILSYLLYQPQSQRYFTYISEFSLFFKNSRNEQLFKKVNSTCRVSQQKILKEKQQNLEQREQKATIKYDNQNNNIDISLLSFSLDPYYGLYDHFLIYFNCQPGDSQKEFGYVIKTKGFLCQLGEFYVDNGCQICSSSQGFYSVTYNTTKCSVFDKTKFFSITSNKIQLLEGYWRPNMLSDSVDYCFKNPKFCEGGWNTGNELCNLGHIGGLCEECDTQNIRGNGKFIKTSQDQSCLSCYGDQDSILPFILTTTWALLSIILSLKSINASNQLFTSLKLRERHFQIIFKLSQDHESVFLKMLLNYLWIYSVIFTFNISFSFSFIFVDQASNTSYFMANNLDCYLSDIEEISLIYSRIITMLVLMLFQFLLIQILSLIYFYLSKSAPQQQYNYDTISNTLIYLYVSNFGGLIKMLCSVISKREISNLSFIQGDVSLEFWSTTHYKWMIAFIIPGLGIFCLLIPFSLFALMYRLRDQFQSMKLRRHISYLFNEYDIKNYFWELIKLTKKTIIILVLTYFEIQILLKASLLGLCLLFYQLLAVEYKPYNISKLNHLDLQAGQICSITIFLAAAKYVCEQQNNQVLSIQLQIVIIILCIILCYPFLKGIILAYKKKYYVLLLASLKNLFKKIKSKSKLANLFKQLWKQQQSKEQRLKKNLMKLKSVSRSSIKMRRQKYVLNQINCFKSQDNCRI
ncbi:unnamed protein product (macronuclear) [Paramecium tetraurelia]|uniref:Transmembrane protein n=1 Tax=Paramecium tetraurelia TaxID=5888 RepID=A0DY25_PARTE|nr:uncharacterized protein GSPATT00021567001 [Paramecium tetraurelia]CAK87942.1 unnamed protein product [Paramecium tetraurelia]|eukprot:XP_001455339.1 hypothetical protein (macronuclear) [Paramecium tetraurelia strain d4-2]